MLAAVFGKKPGEVFTVKGSDRKFRVTETGLQCMSIRTGEWYPEIINKRILSAETE